MQNQGYTNRLTISSKGHTGNHHTMWKTLKNIQKIKKVNLVLQNYFHMY